MVDGAAPVFAMTTRRAANGIEFTRLSPPVQLHAPTHELIKREVWGTETVVLSLRTCARCGRRTSLCPNGRNVF